MPEVLTFPTYLRDLGPFQSAQVVAPPPIHELVFDPENLQADPFTLQYHGGLTIHNPKLALLWCGPAVLDQGKLALFGKDLMERGYLSALGYAGCTSGQFLGNFPGISIPDGTYGDAQFQQFLQQSLAIHGIPQPDGNTIYSLMLPEGVVSQFEGTTQHSCPNPAYCGYHSSLANGQILYTVEPSTSCQGCNQGDEFVARTMVLSHEVAETISNPTGKGWYEDKTGKENGDAVAWIQRQYGPWTVQGYGSPDGRNLMGSFIAAPVQQPFSGSMSFWQWMESHHPEIVQTIESADPLPADKAIFEAWKTWFHVNGWDKVPGTVVAA